MYTGLSLSFCVSDICRGAIKIEEVSKIIAMTCCENTAQWQGVLDIYCEVYWSEFADQAREIALDLINCGRVEQPRLANPSYTHYVSDGNWLDEDGNQFRLQ